METPRLKHRHGTHGGPLVTRFELAGTLTAYGTQQAKVVEWGNEPEDYFAWSGTENYITVGDFNGRFVGTSGMRGYALWMHDREVWEVIALGSGVLIKNEYAGTLPKYGLAYRVGYEFSTGAITVNRVGTAFKRNYIVNGTVDLAQYEYGVAQVDRLVQVAYDSGTPAEGEVFGPLADTFTATKGGPELLVAVSYVDAGNKWMLAEQRSAIDRVLVKTSGSISAGTASGGAPTSTTSYTIYKNRTTASGFSGTKPTAYNYGPAMASGIWAELVWTGDEWRIQPLQCS